MIKKVIYKCFCNCLNSKSQMEIIRKTPAGVSTRRLRCSKHKNSASGNIKSRLTICETCGKDIEFSGKGGTIPKDCKECLRPGRLKRMRDYANTRKAKKTKPDKKFKNDHLRDDSKWDCAGRSECLLEYDKYACTPCLDCKKYEQKVLDITNYLSARGNTNDNFKYQRRERF